MSEQYFLNLQYLGVILVVGCVVGWLAAKIFHGTRFGLVTDIVIGLLGAFIGATLVNTGQVLVDAFIGSPIGAVLLLLVVRFAGQKLR